MVGCSGKLQRSKRRKPEQSSSEGEGLETPEGTLDYFNIDTDQYINIFRYVHTHGSVFTYVSALPVEKS